MRVVYEDDGLRRYFEEARSASGEHPVLIDQFLEDAVEFDGGAVCDGNDVLIGGIMQHIEEAGIHRGDSFAKDLKVSRETINRHIARLGRHCILFHHQMRQSSPAVHQVVDDGIRALRRGLDTVTSLQDLHG